VKEGDKVIAGHSTKWTSAMAANRPR
jgi:hypothetical protein